MKNVLEERCLCVILKSQMVAISRQPRGLGDC
jgi:hypothetical protein